MKQISRGAAGREFSGDTHPKGKKRETRDSPPDLIGLLRYHEKHAIKQQKSHLDRINAKPEEDGECQLHFEEPDIFCFGWWTCQAKCIVVDQSCVGECAAVYTAYRYHESKGKSMGSIIPV